MSRFVLLYHDCPSGVPRKTHWDFMLQAGDVLRTWILFDLPAAWQRLTVPRAVDGQPARAFSTFVPAEEIQPHRQEYLTIEGPLSGDRGSVARLDGGTYVTSEVSSCRIRAALVGDRLHGSLDLWRPHANTPHWQLSFAEETRTTR